MPLPLQSAGLFVQIGYSMSIGSIGCRKNAPATFSWQENSAKRCVPAATMKSPAASRGSTGSVPQEVHASVQTVAESSLLPFLERELAKASFTDLCARSEFFPGTPLLPPACNVWHSDDSSLLLVSNSSLDERSSFVSATMLLHCD